MKTVAIIQARIGSTRLKNKMLLSLHGKPIIEWVIKRVQKAELLDDLIVAIPDTKENNLLESYCHNYGVKTYRGAENDVLDRFFKAAIIVKASKIVRICADNPLIDPEEIDNLITFFNNNECDYAYNHIPYNNYYPDGLGAEIVSLQTLEKLNLKAKKTEREHVFNYIRTNQAEFRIKTFDPIFKELWHPELKFDIDTIKDYEYLHSQKYVIGINSIELVKLFNKTEY